MGKVVKVAVGVAIGVGIAAAAPWLAGAVLGLTGATAAIATAVIAAGLATGAALGFRALGIGAPRPTAATRAPSYPLEPTMPAKRAHWFRHFDLWGVGRFKLLEFTGDCLAPAMTDAWGVVDMEAEIRAGDVFCFDVADRKQAFGPAYQRASSISKIFSGVNREHGFLECTCSNPPAVIHTGLSNLKWAHKILATAPTEKEAERLLRAVRRAGEPVCAA